MPNDAQIVEEGFQRYFNTPLKPYQELVHLFDSEEAHLKYFKKVLYFTKAVIGPMAAQGMRKEDSIVDLASGDGQMSLALALLGYERITLYDMDTQRLELGKRMIHEFRKDLKVGTINGSATELSGHYDVLICYQTIEHLSDEGNYSIAKKSCQLEFLRQVDRSIGRMCYFNAPNRSYPVDGHDTGKLFFHWLPMGLKKFLIGKGHVRCSWAGICRPVTVSFLARHLPHFKRISRYYAFPSMKA
ncbi:MAG: class I SAM-dependent methyltransferase, partial [Flavobacteriales bacterium]|nr:class I SAM-dependent methyltransferase [Flavobacteriales bacterium]